MTRRAADGDTGRRTDRGAATLWTVGLLLLLVTAAGLGVAVTVTTAARHRAQTAADLAALAGAGRFGVAPGGSAPGAVCVRAGEVAAANGAALVRCTATPTGPRSGEVAVVVRVSFRLGPGPGAGGHEALARARAARLPAAATVARGLPDGGASPRPP